MKKKTIILYDFKEKTQVEKTQALRALFGYRDKSNYNYQYERPGELKKIKFSRSKKSIIELDDEKDLSKVAEVMRKLKIQFEVAKIQ